MICDNLLRSKKEEEGEKHPPSSELLFVVMESREGVRLKQLPWRIFPSLANAEI